MKITKSELRKIINEELEVILTNEEAGDLFGEEVRQQLESKTPIVIGKPAPGYVWDKIVGGYVHQNYKGRRLGNAEEQELDAAVRAHQASSLRETTRQQLESHDDGEGSMAVKQLNNIGMMSGDVLDLVDDSDNLDEWVEAKITKAHDYLNTVFNHLRGESVHHVSLAEQTFKSGQKVTHEEYGAGIVTHPGTKNTDVAVKFDKDTGRGRNITVSRGSLK